MHGGEEQEFTTENEVPRRLAKVEEALLAFTDHADKIADAAQVAAEAAAVAANQAQTAASIAAARRARTDMLDHIAPIVAIVMLSAIEGVALYRGLDGAMFAPVVAVIAALAGVKMGDTIRDVFGGKK